MIRITFQPKNLSGQLKLEWEAWERKAEAATEAVIHAWETWRDNGSLGEFKYTFNEKIWGELKNWLLKNVFNDKCAYCETREVRSDYDAEHFRPKAGIRIKVAGRKKQSDCEIPDEYGNSIKHPGYFWLAYTWSNLLPACRHCNSARGKKNQFPVKNSHVGVKRLSATEVAGLACPRIQSKVKTRSDIYYLQLEDLTALEDPLLLHPYFDDPSEHLVFGEFGVVAPRDGSEKGMNSIEVYNLDSEPLVTARQIAQENAFREYGLAFTAGKNLSNVDRITAARSSIAEYIQGQDPYSAAVMANLRLAFPTHGLPNIP